MFSKISNFNNLEIRSSRKLFLSNFVNLKLTLLTNFNFLQCSRPNTLKQMLKKIAKFVKRKILFGVLTFSFRNPSRRIT